MATGYIEKAEALNAETLERRRIERIARMLVHKEEEMARHERALKSIEEEVARLETATMANFDNECCEAPSTRMSGLNSRF